MTIGFEPQGLICKMWKSVPIKWGHTISVIILRTLSFTKNMSMPSKEIGSTLEGDAIWPQSSLHFSCAVIMSKVKATLGTDRSCNLLENYFTRCHINGMCTGKYQKTVHSVSL